MVTLEQKLGLFKKIVEEQIQKDIDLKLSEKEEEITAYLEKERQLLEQNAERTRRSATDRMDRQKSEAVSTLIQKQKREYLKLNEEILADLIDKVQLRLRKFVDGPEYPGYLQQILKPALASFPKAESLTVYLAPASFVAGKQALVEVLDQAGYPDYEIREGEVSYLGGFLVENKAKTIRINKTFAEAVSMKKEDIGQLLHDYIRKGV